MSCARLVNNLILATAATVVVAGGAYRGRWHAADDDSALARPAAIGMTATSRDALARTIERMEGRRARDPQDREATLLLSDALMRQARATGRPALVERALFFLEPAASSRQDDYERHRMLATLYASAHRFREALREAERCRGLRPDDPWNYGVIGDAHLELGEYAEAFAVIQQMVELKPSAASYSRVSYALELQGQMEPAVQAMQLAVDATSPADAESTAWFRTHLGDLLLQQGKLAEARLSYAWAERAFPRHPLLRTAVARLKEAEGDDDGALEMYREVHGATGAPDAAAAIGDILERRGNREEAEHWYAVAEETWRRGGLAERDHLALFLAEHDRHIDEAVTLATSRVATSPTIWSYDALAWASYKAGRLADAERAAAQALRTGTRHAGLLYHTAAIRLASGDRGGARRLIDRIPATAARPRLVPAIDVLRAQVDSARATHVSAHRGGHQ